MTPRDGLPPEPDDDARDDAPPPGSPPDAEPHRRNQGGPVASGGAAPVGWLPRAADALFGEGAAAKEAYGLLTVDVPAVNWVAALTVARDELGCTYFDWLSAVDEPGAGFRVCAHLVALPTESAGVRRLVVRTTVPHEDAVLPTATGVYAGAAWHERETHEMFGLDFTGHPHLDPLLLPDGFEGHPLRKDFVLAARVVKAWPGAKEPGESGHGGTRRRPMLPPGVPDPNEWGPQAGRRPRPTNRRRARAARAARAPARRAGAPTPVTDPPGPAARAAPARARRANAPTVPPCRRRRTGQRSVARLVRVGRAAPVAVLRASAPRAATAPLCDRRRRAGRSSPVTERR